RGGRAVRACARGRPRSGPHGRGPGEGRADGEARPLELTGGRSCAMLEPSRDAPSPVATLRKNPGPASQRARAAAAKMNTTRVQMASLYAMTTLSSRAMDIKIVTVGTRAAGRTQTEC